MSLEKELIKVDYTDDGVPESVKNFRPDVYRDGTEYCLILGSDKDAIVGCGDTLEKAMRQWDEAYWKKRYRSVQ